MPQQHSQREMQMAELAVNEARMIVPGLQALFGFQTMAIFDSRFEAVPPLDQRLHLLALFLTTTSIALIMAPAAFHRIVAPETRSRFFIRFASVMIMMAMAPLTVSLSLDVYVVMNVVLQHQAASAVIAGFLFTLFLGLWFVFPLWSRSSKRARLAETEQKTARADSAASDTTKSE